MPQYRFRFVRASTLDGSDQLIELPDDQAAFAEGLLVAGDLSRSIFGDISSAAEWKLEIYSAQGRLLHRITIAVDVFDGKPMGKRH